MTRGLSTAITSHMVSPHQGQDANQIMPSARARQFPHTISQTIFQQVSEFRLWISHPVLPLGHRGQANPPPRRAALQWTLITPLAIRPSNQYCGHWHRALAALTATLPVDRAATQQLFLRLTNVVRYSLHLAQCPFNGQGPFPVFLMVQEV